MKVLFSNPPWWAYENGRLMRGIRAGSRWPLTDIAERRPDRFALEYVPYPYFMGYATTYLQRETGIDVSFRDSIALSESYEKYYAYIKDHFFDYIFVESSTPTWELDKGILRELKKLSPRSKLVVTGPIAAIGERLLDEAPIEALIQGEYEKGSVRVINGETGLIPFDFLSAEEMNAAPLPYYDFDHVYRYWQSAAPPIYPMAIILSNRGCPFKCIFCSWPATMTSNDPDGTNVRTVRHYTPEYMEAFVTELVEKYKIRHIFIEDDTFNLGDKHVLDICNVMSKFDIPWGAMCRADTLNNMDTWRAMRESGCYWVMIGYESGSQWVIDNIINKNLDLERAREVTLKLKEMGFFIHGTFTYGHPGETPEQMEETRRYRDSLGLPSYQESGTSVHEGTPLAKLHEKGSLGAYKGATLNGGFEAETDGMVKIRKIKSRIASEEEKTKEEQYTDDVVQRTLDEYFAQTSPRIVGFYSRAQNFKESKKSSARFEIEKFYTDLLPKLASLSPLLVVTAPLEDSPSIEAKAGEFCKLYPLSRGRTPEDAKTRTMRREMLFKAIREKADSTIVLGLGSNDFYLMLDNELKETQKWDVITDDLLYLNLQLAETFDGRILFAPKKLKDDVAFYYSKWGVPKETINKLHTVQTAEDVATLLKQALRSMEDRHER